MIGFFAAGAMGAGGPPPGDFPALLSTTGSAYAFGTANNQAMPDTVAAGDLLLVSVLTGGSSSNSVVNAPSGWTALGSLRGGTGPRMSLFYKIAAGTEGGGVVNFPSVGATEGVGECLRVQSGTFQGAPYLNTLSAANSSTHPVNAISPPWGSANNLFLMLFATSTVSISGYPYPTSNFSYSSGVNSVASCSRSEATSTLSPPPFTTSVNASSVTAGIAVRPA